MDLHLFDLNLLVALDALLRECNVTQAGNRLNLSQPAMSGALARLRSHFQDELLVSVGRRMVRTPLGDELVQPVREILLQVQGDARIQIGVRSRHLDPSPDDRGQRLRDRDPDGRRAAAGAVRGSAHHVRSPPPRAARGRGAGQRRARLPDRAGERGLRSACAARSCSRTRSRAWHGRATRDVGATLSPEEYLNLGHVVVNVGQSPVGNDRRGLPEEDQAQAPRGDLDAQLLPGASTGGGNRPHHDDHDAAGAEIRRDPAAQARAPADRDPAPWWKCCTGIAPTTRTPRTSGSGKS